MTPNLRRLPASYLALLVLLALLPSARAPAATFEVDTTADAPDANPGDGVCADATGACTLRAAVLEAQWLLGADVVRLPAGHYLAGLMIGDERDGLTLKGSSANTTIIDAAGHGPVIAGYGSGDLIVTDLTITGGGLAQGSFFNGGGIFYLGDLHLRRVAVLYNLGGGVIAMGGSIVESVIAGNSGVAAAQTDAIINSTISGNTSWPRVYCTPPGYFPTCWCEAFPVASGRVVFSTIANNHVRDCEDLPLLGPPPHALSGEVLGSLISNPGLANCAGEQVSLGHNLDSDGTCGLRHPTDLSGVDPILGPLQYNGVPTPTHALLAGSPALDAIPAEDCTYDHDGDPGTPEVPLATDQRGVRRPQGGRCDIGAYERGCGLGAEMAILLPLLVVMRKRRI